MRVDLSISDGHIEPQAQQNSGVLPPCVVERSKGVNAVLVKC